MYNTGIVKFEFQINTIWNLFILKKYIYYLVNVAIMRSMYQIKQSYLWRIQFKIILDVN